MKIPAYVTRTYLAKHGHAIRLKPGLEEYTLDSYPDVVFVCKPTEGKAVNWAVTTRKLERPAPKAEAAPQRE